MRTPAAIGVNDDLTTSQAGIALRATNDKATRGLNLNKGGYQCKALLASIPLHT